MKFSTILFDLDETLFDSYESIKVILKELLNDYDYCASDEDLNKYIGINSVYWERFQNGEMDFNSLKIGRFRDYLCELNINIKAEAFSTRFMARFKDAISLIDGASLLCLKLHQAGYKLYVASNGEDSVQKRRINKAGLSSYFDGYFNSDVMGYCKPSVEYYNYIKERIHEKDPKRILMVGDSYSNDVEGAAKAGISGCWFYRKESLYNSVISTIKRPPGSNLSFITVRSLRELYSILII